MDQAREQQIIKDFREKLKKFRNDKKLSLRVLADIADLDFGKISEIETAKINLTLTTIVRMAEALEIDSTKFFQK